MIRCCSQLNIHGIIIIIDTKFEKLADHLILQWLANS